MKGPAVTCGDERRRLAVRSQELNGLDFLEVSEDQLTLTVVFMGKAPEDIGRANVRIDGGQRVRDIRVVEVRLCIEDDPDLDDCMRVTVDRPGDFSRYRLSVVRADPRGRPTRWPLEGFDPRYSHLDFSFKVNCPSDLDCLPVDDCPPPVLAQPAIDYLAKDYASFRRLILDRLSLVMPAWTERHVPDIGIALVEVLAYVGDHLSYHQDAVATEAYLDTARQRISVRRHVRLIDYPMHDGCNARTWVCVETTSQITLTQRGLYFTTRPPGLLTDAPAVAHVDFAGAARGDEVIFEPLVQTWVEDAEITLYPGHNEIHFWTWGDKECCLPPGTTQATLDDTPPESGGGSTDDPGIAPRVLHLRAGDVIIFEEVLGPRTGAAADADPLHRQAVRLTKVKPATDHLYNRPIVEIEWAPEDALRFPLCISVVGGPECAVLEPVSVARGNVILVDHGWSLTRCGDSPKTLNVPPPRTELGGCRRVCEPLDPIAVPVRYSPVLAQSPVTQQSPFPSPAEVARGQALVLGRIPHEVHDRLVQLRRTTEAGRVLAKEELDELRLLFGETTLRKVGLAPPEDRKRPRPTTAREQAAALARLLAREAKLLDRKLRWLSALTRRARGGFVLGPDEVEEIGELWGAHYAQGLEASSAAHLGPARDALRQDPRTALAAIRLRPPSDPSTDLVWTVRRDLLASGGRDRHFVAEVQDDQQVRLRFGDGEHGRAVDPGSELLAEYRVGNGVAGNVAAEAISLVVFCTTKQSAITRVRNPLPAEGGTELETSAEVKLFAPGTFHHSLARAITPDDYASLAGKVPGIQRAAAALRWTGSWYEVDVAVDPLGTMDVDPHLLAGVEEALARYRRIGHDVVVAPGHSVALDVAMLICVLPHYQRGHVKSALLDAFSNRVLPGGKLGFFHPDNLTFGGNVHMSSLIAAAQAIPGVESVQVTSLRRLGEGDRGELDQGVLTVGPLELVRLDNDPGNPENGQLRFDLRGGR